MEAKYLMLRHAFETLGAMRVELKRSRRPILRLGGGRGIKFTGFWTSKASFICFVY